MTKHKLTNIAASVRQRLKNKAAETGQGFDAALMYFAMERFLYRLAASPHVNKFVLKGALLLSHWNPTTARPTRDIDLHGRMDNGVDSVSQAIREVCAQAVEPDGLVFDAASVVATVIREEAEYSGVRLRFLGKLVNARIPMQVDVGFGDVIVPGPAWIALPGWLGFPPPKLRGYRIETVVAEKLQAMVFRGLFNTRLKDYYDIYSLAQRCTFEGTILASAIRATFEHRNTTLPPDPPALSPSFAEHPDRSRDWRVFLLGPGLRDAPADLAEVVRFLATFLLPILAALAENQPFQQHWQAPGPWLPRDG